MKQGEKEIYILIYIFSLYNIMSKRSNVDNAEANKKFMAEYQERQQQRLQQQQRQQQSSSYKTPNNRITKFSQGNPNVSKKRRNDGKLKAPIPKKLLTKDIRENRLTHRPTNPNAKALHKKQKEWDAALESDEKTAVDSLLNLGKGTRKKRKRKRKKKRTKRKYKKKTRKKRKRRTRKKRKKKH